jgi:prolyl oligopeptidase
LGRAEGRAPNLRQVLGWLRGHHLPPAFRAQAPGELTPAARPKPSAAASSEPDASADAKLGYPPTDERPVTDDYHGVRVVDPYRWLERADDDAVRAWTAAQNELSRPLLDGLAGRDGIRERIRTILTARGPEYESVDYRAGKLFALEDKPPLQQARLVLLESPDTLAGLRVLLDPNDLDPSGKTTIDWYVPSFDGSKVAVSLSRAGTESGDVHVYDVVSGKPVEDPVPRVHGGTAGGSLAWSPNGEGFYYTRYPRGAERSGDDLNF